VLSIGTKINDLGQPWRIQRLPEVFKYPLLSIISGTGKATDFKFGLYSQGPSEQKRIKNFGEKGVWAYPGTVQNLQMACGLLVRYLGGHVLFVSLL